MTWPYTMTTPYWWDFVPNATFNRNLSGFHRTFATGVACRQGTLAPPDTWSRTFGTCICSTCWDQSFSELVVILPNYALRISLGTFSILLVNLMVHLFMRGGFWSMEQHPLPPWYTTSFWYVIHYHVIHLPCNRSCVSQGEQLRIRKKIIKLYIVL